MSSSKFIVKTHTFPGQHIRHYPGATRNGDADVQYLEVKQYVPLDNQKPQEGDTTIIGLHATSFPKELYEPLWDDMLAISQRNGFKIRSIWFADASHQSASGVLNEQTLADDPSFSDYARDVLHMTNVFREHMIHPLVGIGHSMGATALVELSCMHPRLFASLVLIDPILGAESMEGGEKMIAMTSSKPDLFPSRAIAEQGFKKAFKHWDPRTFKLWMEYGLRDTPTLLYPKPGKVTLRTTKASEVWSYARPQFEEPNEDGSHTESGRIKYPDADPAQRPVYRPEPHEVLRLLTRIRPDVLWVFPNRTHVPERANNEKVARTGTATGGSGGMRAGRVAKAIVKGGSHLCTFEDPTQCARIIVDWLARDIRAWQARAEYERTHRDKKSLDRIRLSDEWVRRANEFAKTRL